MAKMDATQPSCITGLASGLPGYSSPYSKIESRDEPDITESL